MYEVCIENFLKTCDPTHIERHSDSSDFENTNIPVVSPKCGKHSLLMDNTCFDKPEKDRNSCYVCKKNTYNNVATTCDQHKLPQKKYRYKLSNMNNNESIPKHQTNPMSMFTRSNNKNRGDQSSINLIEKSYSKSIIRNKVMPGLSTLFRRSQNCTKRKEHIEDRTNNNYNCDRRYCPHCKRPKQRKRSRGRREYSVHPVYTMNENFHGYRFANTNPPISLLKVNALTKNKDYELSFDNNSTCSVTDNEIIRKRKYNKTVKEIKQRLEREMKKFHNKQTNSRNDQQQQFPSKSQLKSPYQVFTSSSCHVKSDSKESNNSYKLPSSSSAFWDFLAGKMKFQVEKAEVVKPCDCIKPLGPCSPETCEFKGSRDKLNETKINSPSKLPNCCKLIEKLSSSSSSSSKKIKEEPKVICECYSNKKKKKNAESMTQDEETKPCQVRHDDITANCSKKYNGKILCIHNPPCVLINGCLNLPPPKSDGASNYWPVTQSKKSSFARMCKKIKRSKEKKLENEQGSQYHPPYAELQKCFPEFETEKIIQSVCNHTPPCEIVRGCYRAKYDPKLHNSCIHVPSCIKLPECLLEKTNTFQNNTCVHKPKCVELPLCSRKYMVLTAKENVGTQFNPKTKTLCRHEPPCLMIPKCLARAIYGDIIPIGAIPGCGHQPSCDMIPACCRKSAKEMVSVPSQYPNQSCRIV